MTTVLIPLERHTREVEAVKAALENTKRLYQEMVDAALQWREKYLRLEGQANTLSAEALRATNVAEEFANQAQAADHCVGALRSELDVAKGQVRTLQGQVRMLEASEALAISDLRSERDQLQHVLNEVRKRADVNEQNARERAVAVGNLHVELHRKDKDLQLLRSELERSRVAHADTAKEFDKVRMNFRHTATEVNEAYLRGYVQGRRDGQSERDNAAMLANDDPCNLPIKGIHLEHRKISSEFTNHAIDLHDLLHELTDEDPVPFQIRVKNPALTGQVIAFLHLLRDFHNTPCPFNEG